MPPKKRFITCEICGFRASRANREKRMFMARFPLDEARCKEWVKVVGKEDLVYVPIEKLHTLKYLCGNHFKDSAFNKKKNRLKKTAVPSKNLKADPLPDEMLVEFPSHVISNIDFTNDYITQGISEKKTVIRVEAVAGLSKSDIYAKSCGVARMVPITDYQKTYPHCKPRGTKQTIRTIVESDHSYCHESWTRSLISSEVLPSNVEPRQTSKTGILHNTGLDSKSEETAESPAADVIEDDYEECVQMSPEGPLSNLEGPPPNLDGPRHIDESAIFSWQADNFVIDEAQEVPDGHLEDEVETCMYQDQDKGKVDNSSIPAEDYIYRCNNCGGNILGFRYTCVQCVDWDLCGACEARELHAAHYVLRVPSPRPYGETQAILAAIRHQLLRGVIKDENDGLNMEVKEEPVVAWKTQFEDDPLSSGEVCREEYIEDVISESEYTTEHLLPQRPSNKTQYTTDHPLLHRSSTETQYTTNHQSPQSPNRETNYTTDHQLPQSPSRETNYTTDHQSPQSPSSKTQYTTGHQSPQKPKYRSRSGQNVTHNETVTIDSDDDIESKADDRDRPQETRVAIDDGQTTTHEVTTKIQKSHHSEMQGMSCSIEQNLHIKENSRNNTRVTDIENTALHKRREVIVVPRNQLKTNSRRMRWKIPPGVDAKGFVQQLLIDRATVRLTALNDRKWTTKCQETLK